MVGPADASQPSLYDILSFWTGLREVPPMGFHSGLVVKYLPYSELPRSHACFETVKLPVVHDMEREVWDILVWCSHPLTDVFFFCT